MLKKWKDVEKFSKNHMLQYFLEPTRISEKKYNSALKSTTQQAVPPEVSGTCGVVS